MISKFNEVLSCAMNAINKKDFSMSVSQKKILKDLQKENLSDKEKETLENKFYATLELENLQKAFAEEITKIYLKKLKKCYDFEFNLDLIEMREFVKEERFLRETKPSIKFNSKLLLKRFEKAFNKKFKEYIEE